MVVQGILMVVLHRDGLVVQEDQVDQDTLHQAALIQFLDRELLRTFLKYLIILL